MMEKEHMRSSLCSLVYLVDHGQFNSIGSKCCWGMWEFECLCVSKWQSAWLHPWLAWMIMGTVITPLGRQRERLWVFVCVSGERVGGTEAQTISTSLPKPPTVVPCTKTRVYINHTHTHTWTRQSWHGAVLRWTLLWLGQKRSDRRLQCCCCTAKNSS